MLDGESIYITKAINSELQEQIMSRLENLMKSAPPYINIYLTCDGGFHSSGFGLIDFIRYITRGQKTLIRTISLAQVDSMAIPLYLVGDDRYISPQTLVTFHHPAAIPEKRRYPQPEIKRTERDLEHRRRQYEQIVVRATGRKVTPKLLRQWRENETILTASQALKYGIAHHLLR
jgi:ATP-dependent protease ClpP protease subunit